MKIYRLSDAMFNTFNLENYTFNSFQKHHQNFIKKYGPKNAQKLLNTNNIINIGYAKITPYLQKIFEKYGQPKSISTTIYFYIINHEHPWGKNKPDVKNPKAFFIYQNHFIIGLITNNINNIQFNSETLSLISHEIQHFLRKLYNPKENKSNQPYWQQSSEIQAYCYQIAKSTAEDLKELYQFKINLLIKNKNLNKLKSFIAFLNNPNTTTQQKIIIQEIKNFIAHLEQQQNIKINEESKKIYYLSAIRNFNKFVQNIIENIKLNNQELL